MGELENLLKGSIKEFEDKTNNALAIPCVYIPGTNGLPYLIKNTSLQKNVSIALHVSADQEQREDGIYDSGYISIDTHENLMEIFGEGSDIVIILYKEYIIGINRSGDFNSQANTYHYTGELLLNRNDDYIILDEDEATTLILSDSTTKWLDLATYFGLSIFPSFVSTKNKNDTHLIVSITNSKALNNVHQIDDTTKRQYKKDTVKLFLVNSTLIQAQELAEKIFKSPEKYGYFGIQDFPGWKTINEYTQKSFGLKQNIRSMELKINYQLDITTETGIKYFKQISATINDNIIATKKIEI